MKTLKKLLAIVLAVVCVFGMTACGPKGKSIDKTKTQLYISHFNGGYGNKWINQVIKDFEETYANVSFEEGKKGVQVMKTDHKETGKGMAADLRTRDDWVFFNEQVPYYTLAYANDLYDITDVINGTFDIRAIAEANGIYAIDAEGNKTSVSNIYSPKDKDIIGKFNDVQTSELLVNGKYFAVPHYEAYTGLTYDADLWNEFKLYRSQLDNTFSLAETDDQGNDQKDLFTAGPDGLYGTYDDGLPATYEEFFELCQELSTLKIKAITWSGDWKNHFYITNVLNQLVTDYHGAEEKVAYTFNGTVTDYITGWDGETPITGTKEITAQNGSDVFNRAGYYYAFKWLEEIVTGGDKKYTHADCYNGSSHTDTQSRFLLSTKKTPTAMIAEGVWWQAEAAGTFRSMSSGGKNPTYTAMGRDLRFMPLPKADTAHIGETTLLESNRSYMFMRSNVPADKVALCKLFIQFVNEEERLQSFSVLTNAPKALTYDVTEDQLAEMTPFGRSIIEMKNAENGSGEKMTTVLYQIANQPIYYSNESGFARHELLDAVAPGYDAPSLYFRYGTSKDDTPTALEYFNAFKNGWASQWSTYLDKLPK